MIKAVQFGNRRGQIVRGFVHAPATYDTAVIFLHGFPAHCDYPALRYACKALCWWGNLVLRFNFSGTHTSDGNFEDTLLSQEVEDIRCAVDYLTQQYQFKKLVLVGHSTGAVGATLYAHQDKRVDKTILISPVISLAKVAGVEFTKQQLDDFREKGKIFYNAPGQWHHGKTLNKAFYDEFFTLDIPGAIRNYRRPLLIIQGSDDQRGSLFHGWDLYVIANEPKELAVIERADHNFPTLWQKVQVLWKMREFIRKS